jgi:hypothetical protein
MTINRQDLLDNLSSTLQAHPDVQAAWQGGAAAFSRVDEYSDIDLMVVANEGANEAVHTAIEAGLRDLGELDFKMEMPRPAWHGLNQVFYRLSGGNPFHFLDIAIGSKEKVLALSGTPVHGQPVLLFDKHSAFTPAPFDTAAHLKNIASRLEHHRAGYEMFRHLTLKEIKRGNAIEAFQYYASFTLRPLIELLRIQYNPVRYDFSTRYIHYELPVEIVSRLEPLYFTSDLEELSAKHAEASAWIKTLLDEINLESVRNTLEKEGS